MLLHVAVLVLYFSDSLNTVTLTLLPCIRGPIDTRIFRDGEEKGLFDANVMGGATLLGRMGQAEEVAHVLCFLLSDDASYVTGGKFPMNRS